MDHKPLMVAGAAVCWARGLRHTSACLAAWSGLVTRRKLAGSRGAVARQLDKSSCKDSRASARTSKDSSLVSRAATERESWSGDGAKACSSDEDVMRQLARSDFQRAESSSINAGAQVGAGRAMAGAGGACGSCEAAGCRRPFVGSSSGGSSGLAFAATAWASPVAGATATTCASLSSLQGWSAEADGVSCDAVSTSLCSDSWFAGCAPRARERHRSSGVGVADGQDPAVRIRYLYSWCELVALVVSMRQRYVFEHVKALRDHRDMRRARQRHALGQSVCCAAAGCHL